MLGARLGLSQIWGRVVNSDLLEMRLIEGWWPEMRLWGRKSLENTVKKLTLGDSVGAGI